MVTVSSSTTSVSSFISSFPDSVVSVSDSSVSSFSKSLFSSSSGSSFSSSTSSSVSSPFSSFNSSASIVSFSSTWPPGRWYSCLKPHSFILFCYMVFNGFDYVYYILYKLV